ncbi:DUF58 domain-containing protein [Celeribacter indicus]|uniref:DUF58 domain-containing protein n=1 Tax=Celeribacter indicus TaxID=1208324 RepID=A0A0B5DPI2_9RHOB|nr:DUF58 domain-containing protein [Celeribacter indicus]AJE45493.1 hypothetical protein P73_0778 [Celeribacter indicus]SDW87624.1 Protein of unknown function DUF58 [Celeribacter indicus]
MTDRLAPSGLRARAEALAGPLPPLQAQAEQLARTLLLGGHGRRQSGMGDEFWQYRPAQAGDPGRAIDWRRSARSDGHYVREKEWQAAQSVHLWVDLSASMGFASDRNLPAKRERAALLAMAISILLMKGGERVALASLGTPPRIGALQLRRIAEGLRTPGEEEFGAPDVARFLPHSRALFMSDFLGPLDRVEEAVGAAADRGIGGALCQILDPAEEAFPYQGRTVFTSMTGGIRHETLRAADLRDRYLDRLAERKARLEQVARHAGWRFATHHTNDAAQPALLWLYQAMEGPR